MVIGSALVPVQIIITILLLRSRILVIALGLIFGTWFLIKALTGLGII